MKAFGRLEWNERVRVANSFMVHSVEGRLREIFQENGDAVPADSDVDFKFEDEDSFNFSEAVQSEVDGENEKDAEK